MAIHIGTSGWSYDHWTGLVYPKGGSGLTRLDYYVQRFRTVEVNNTFYRWPKDETFTTWRQHLPEGFVMSVKASRAVTHLRKLHEPGPWLERMESGLKCLGPFRGVLLFQLPPQFAINLDRLDGFLRLLSATSRNAFEFRHPSWHCDEALKVLERHGAAYCVVSGLGQPCLLRASAPFVYVRFHGPENRRYHGSYPDDELREWTKAIRGWDQEGRDVFVYFNNDVGGHAVHNAETLRRMLER